MSEFAAALGRTFVASRRTAVGLAALALLLTALPSGARAAVGYEVDGSTPSIALDGEVAHGVAIDQSSQRIYVAELTADSNAQKPGQIEQLESSGVPTSASPFTVAGDKEAAFSGVAVNPITHGIYAAQFIFMTPFGNFGQSKIDLFSSTGAPGAQFATGSNAGKAVQIATDSSGDVYFPSDVTDTVQVFNEGGVLQESIGCAGCPGGGFVTPYSVAIDGAGNLYVVDIGLDRVLKFTHPGGSYVYSSLLQSGLEAGSVGVDPADGTVLVGDLPQDGDFHVVAYDSAGAQFDDFGAGLFGASPFGILTAGQIAVNATTRKVYVTDASDNSIHVFGRATVSAPTATTDPASPVGQVAATLKATFNAGIHALTDCHFEFVDDAGFEASVYGSATSAACAPPPSGSGPLPAEADLTGLSPSTTYHFRVAVASNAGTAVGNSRTFTTLPSAAATVTTQAASGISQTQATLAGKVNPHGGSVSDCHFEYGVSLSYEFSKPCSNQVGLVSTDVAQTLKVTGLSPSTTYHYRLVVTSNAGLVNGNDREFTTLPPAPTVTTESASGITQTSAVLAGTINPNGAASSCHFDYGPTSAYGSSVACAADPGEGSAAVAQLLPLSGLSVGATYHYRLVGANAGGTTNGLDRSFTTQSPTPIVQPLPEQQLPIPPVVTPPRQLKCKKGFRKAKVHGKLRCVKKKHRKRRRR